MVDTFNYFHWLISDSNFFLVDKNTIVNPPIMHMTLNWCFTRVLIDAIGFNRCFIISSFNIATLQQFFKKRQNRRYYHFNNTTRNQVEKPYKYLTCRLNFPATEVLNMAPNVPRRERPVRMLTYWGARSSGFTWYPEIASPLKPTPTLRRTRAMLSFLLLTNLSPIKQRASTPNPAIYEISFIKVSLFRCHVNQRFPAVTWLKYYRYGVKLYSINQSIKDFLVPRRII